MGRRGKTNPGIGSRGSEIGDRKVQLTAYSDSRFPTPDSRPPNQDPRSLLGYHRGNVAGRSANPRGRFEVEGGWHAARNEMAEEGFPRKSARPRAVGRA